MSVEEFLQKEKKKRKNKLRIEKKKRKKRLGNNKTLSWLKSNFPSIIFHL